ncbi:MAG: SRPBCC family protein [Rhabdochlamydiaceae bacterium]
MSNQDYKTTFLVDQTPKEAFDAINNVRGWWGGIEGSTDKLGAEFTYHYEDAHRSKQKIIEFIPNKKVVWLVTSGGPNFTKEKTEWKGTKIMFDVSKEGDKTRVQFTHQGLIPKLECYDACSDAWGSYIKSSLRSLITTGKGQPD